MDKLFQECYTSRLSDTGSVLPFFWQHGEDHETLRAEMDAIRRAGITEFCVESRTHEEFCKDQWWIDFRFMLEYARAHGMRVWLLDDKRFPTGYANGYLETHPELRRKILRLDYRDYTGPTLRTKICPVKIKPEKQEAFVSITAWKRSEDFRTVEGDPVDLTHRIGADGLIDWDVPDGTWRIYYVIRSGDLPLRENYIDMLSAESCKAQIHAVYEPHYERFKEYFGNTLRGFFSDEPSFETSVDDYFDTVGKENSVFPWRDDLPQLIAEEIGHSEEEVRLRLAGLWHTLPDISPAVRAGYMDRITYLYRENFTRMIGAWCRERKVLYIGHIIEDDNAHQRLGFGGGHFFRALEGQSMAGTDIVLNQMVPRNTLFEHTAPLSGKTVSRDPAFFNYAMAKMAASLSHITPHMENRAMAEVFGAFGWAEGVGYMKYLADHFLVSGVNHFVPHAYTPKYPDLDCPPHFYCHGMNPQEEAFGLLMRYMQKLSRITAESVHKADVAVFYNAQAEWTGGKLTLFQETCRRLTRDQIDFDILPEDTLYTAEVEEGKLRINQETYGALIVPYCQILPVKILQTFARLQAEGLPVLFEQAAPERSADGVPAEELLPSACTVDPQKLTATLREMGLYHVTAHTPCPELRVYRVDRQDTVVYLLFNEGASEIDHWITFADAETPVFFDVWNNRIRKPQIQEDALRVKLASGGALVLLCGEGRDALPYEYDLPPCKDLEGRWEISLRDAGSDQWRTVETEEPLPSFNTADREPSFCGFMEYKTEFVATGNERVLDLGLVGEIATVRLNDRNCGTAVAAPYLFDISKAVTEGNNKLTVTVVNNPVYRERENDEFITYLPLPPSGLLGPVKIG